MSDPYASPKSESKNDSELPESEIADTLLILAGLSFLLCGPFTALPGLFMARAERQRILQGEVAPNGNVDVAFWLMVANLFVTLVTIVLSAFFVFYVLWMFDSPPNRL